ncbi:MAG: MMPL family transporter [Neptuniibacter sp.]
MENIEGFDKYSGNWAERLLFNYRAWVLAVCLIITAVLTASALKSEVNASFLKTVPNNHPFITNFLDFQNDIKGLGNALRIVVETAGEEGIFSPKYIDYLKKINDEVYLLPHVDRPFMKSVWMPAVRWTGVTEYGYEGGPVMPLSYNGSDLSVAQFRENVLRSGEIGKLVAPDFKSTIIYIPLKETAEQPIDYADLSNRLEELRSRYESQGLTVRITGFAKVMGDLIDGLYVILTFFGFALLVTTAILFYFTRCARSTALVLTTTSICVVWLLGLLPILGLELNPYSILVPFLIFAIGVSHGTQKMNGIMQEIGRGTHRLIAARYTFRRLFIAGVTALLSDVVGFAILVLIDVPVIKEFALIASLGVGLLVLTNLALLPILLSYVGVSKKAAQRSTKYSTVSVEDKNKIWQMLDLFTQRKPAALVLLVAAAIGTVGYIVGERVQVGDLNEGAAELRADSRYNLDSAYMVSHYQAGSDVFVVFGVTESGDCANYDHLRLADKLEWELRQLPIVDGANSFPSLVRQATVGMNEGNLKWFDLVGNQSLINGSAARAPRELFNATCDLLPIYIYLKDHKADSLRQVVAAVERFQNDNPSEGIRFEMAGGNAGIEAATNQVVEQAHGQILYGVYGVVIVLCAVAFRSWRAVVCAVIPLVLTSIMVEALMVWLEIGIKVSTLPVIALGVGIGIDYALYVLSVVQTWLRAGVSLSEAYYRSLVFTGRVVIFTGCTLAIGVGVWVLSPIKFQADMGILLTFMFIWNMLGALILLPALAHFILAPKSKSRPVKNKCVGAVEGESNV